ncbi:MAG TPA: hypothetical protein VNT51_04935, partial [Miltoncostaeaceae bacterium]|nr:hypothetical protein [Miltoncostaeaceae bacterium]
MGTAADTPAPLGGARRGNPPRRERFRGGTDDPARRYQGERLAVGIVGIGLMLAVAVVLAHAGGAALDPVARGPAPLAGALAGLALAAVVSLVLLPLDVWGGVRAERRHGMGATEGWSAGYLPAVALW